jgi:integrase
MDAKGQYLEVLNSKDLTIPIGNVNPKKDLQKYWTKEEIDYKLALINNYKHKMLIIFLWMSGVRVSEAITLKKNDIDFANQVMTVQWLKSRKWNKRVVPLHPLLKNILEVYTAPLKESDKVFPFSRQRAWQICKKHLGGHPHQLRHSFAVHLLRNGTDIVILHRLLGHSSIQTTMEYLKIVPVDQGKELTKINF